MWPRMAELLLGAWLACSPLIFRRTAATDEFSAIDVTVGTTVIVLSLCSFAPRTAGAHFVTAVLALGLAAFAYFAWPRPGPAGAQNELTVALLLLMFAIIPNEANRPPKPWRTTEDH
jgi:hypothetical protein